MSEAIADLLRKVTEGQETVFDLAKHADEDKVSIAITKRTLQPEPVIEKNLARADARAHVFHDIKAFAEYLKRETNAYGSTNSCIVLADVDKRTITAVLNEDDETDRESVSFVANVHPLFAEWDEMLETPIEVVKFGLFVMKNRRVIAGNGKDLAMTFQQIKMSKTVEIAKGAGRKSLNGVMTTIEINGQKSEGFLELPDTIAIGVPLFVDTDPQRIEIDLLVTDDGDDVVVYMTASDVEMQRIAAFEEMVRTLRDETGLLVGLGQVKHREWKLVR